MMIYVFHGRNAQKLVGTLISSFSEADAKPITMIHADGPHVSNFLWRDSDKILSTISPIDLEQGDSIRVLNITAHAFPGPIGKAFIATKTSPERSQWLLRHLPFTIYSIDHEMALDLYADEICEDNNISRMERFHG